AGIIGFFNTNPGKDTDKPIIKSPHLQQIQDHPGIFSYNLICHSLEYRKLSIYQLHNPCVLQKKEILLFLRRSILETSTSASDLRRNNVENYLLLQYNPSQTLYFVSCHHPLQSLSALFF